MNLCEIKLNNMKNEWLAIALMSASMIDANAVNMCVKTDDGNIVRYEVDHVIEVFFEDEILLEAQRQGVSVDGKVGEYTYVDLGLKSGKLWATYNVGTDLPTESGDYYAWGETSPKTNYTWETYTLCKGKNGTFTKYCLSEKEGDKDGKSVLEAEDDAVVANWGDKWRMPTKEEMQELIDGCDWEYTTDFAGKGIVGRIGTSKENKKTIFIPAVGTIHGEKLYSGDSWGFYWTSSLDENRSDYAHYLDYSPDMIRTYSSNRFFALPVRGVVK